MLTASPWNLCCAHLFTLKCICISEGMVVVHAFDLSRDRQTLCSTEWDLAHPGMHRETMPSPHQKDLQNNTKNDNY